VNLNANLHGLTLRAGTSTGRTTENDCQILSKLPEMQLVNTISATNPTGVVAQRPASFCDRQSPWQTQFKGFAVYTVPRIDVMLSGTTRSIPGAAMRASFDASNAYLAANSTLGRPLAGGAANLAIDILEPNTVFLDRRNELDLRFGDEVTPPNRDRRGRRRLWWSRSSSLFSGGR
jgi:hypothetical protein